MFSHCKKFYRLLSVLVTIALSIGMASCGSDDESSERGLMGWYTDLTDVARESDFSEINTAINNKEQLSSYYYGGERHTYIASYDLFVNSSTGFYNDTNSHMGRLRFKIKSCINVVRILNDNTLMTYVGYLYAAGKNMDDDILYKFYAGSIFGYMAYQGTPSYKTYIRVDNKLVVDDGTIYTIVDGGLIVDGSSTKMSKYDPTKMYD